MVEWTFGELCSLVMTIAHVWGRGFKALLWQLHGLELPSSAIEVWTVQLLPPGVRDFTICSPVETVSGLWENYQTLH
jgi:hypothetical protein